MSCFTPHHILWCYSHELIESCQVMDHKRIKYLVNHNPHWIWTARDGHMQTAAHVAAYNDDIGTLKLFYDTITKTQFVSSERERKMLIDTFQSQDNNGQTPVHLATRMLYGNNGCLEFLVETACPDGTSILEETDDRGNTVAHFAAYAGQIEALEYIVRNTPSSIDILQQGNNKGLTAIQILKRVSLELPSKFIRKIPLLGLENEETCIIATLRLRQVSVFDTNSLVSLVLSIIQQETERLRFVLAE